MDRLVSRRCRLAWVSRSRSLTGRLVSAGSHCRGAGVWSSSGCGLRAVCLLPGAVTLSRHVVVLLGRRPRGLESWLERDVVMRLERDVVMRLDGDPDVVARQPRQAPSPPAVRPGVCVTARARLLR
jgi:hypothetical protein